VYSTATVALCAAAVAAVVGCEGQDSELFGPEPVGGTAGVAGAGGEAGATGGQGGVGTAGAAASGGLATGGQGGQPTGGTGGSEPDPNAGVVDCADEFCVLTAGEICCLTTFPSLSGQCLWNTDGCPLGSFAIRCDGPEDCAPSEICCGNYNPGLGYTSVSCASACSGFNKVIICDPDAAEPCPSGSCQPSDVLPDGYFVCRD